MERNSDDEDEELILKLRQAEEMSSRNIKKELRHLENMNIKVENSRLESEG